MLRNLPPAAGSPGGSVEAMTTRRAVVTGASSGIGEATARALRSRGWDVVAVARRADRLQQLETETGAVAFAADLTVDADVAGARRLGSRSRDRCTRSCTSPAARAAPTASRTRHVRRLAVDVRGQRPVGAAARRGAPAAPARGRRIGRARRHALRDLDRRPDRLRRAASATTPRRPARRWWRTALRLELNGEPIRVIEVAPGMVRTDEFTLNRLGGDRDAADAVYAGVEDPLTADDVADVIAYALERPRAREPRPHHDAPGRAVGAAPARPRTAAPADCGLTGLAVAMTLPELAGAGLIDPGWAHALEPVGPDIAALGERLRGEVARRPSLPAGRRPRAPRVPATTRRRQGAHRRAGSLPDAGPSRSASRSRSTRTCDRCRAASRTSIRSSRPISASRVPRTATCPPGATRA